MNITFKKSLILSLVIIFSANIYYVMNSIPPDGRWKIQIPVTSFFIIIYSFLFTFISKKILKNPKNYYFMIVFNAVLSFLFISFATPIERQFQYADAFYVMQFIPTLPYIIILGLGIIFYIPAAMFWEKISNNKKYEN